MASKSSSKESANTPYRRAAAMLPAAPASRAFSNKFPRNLTISGADLGLSPSAAMSSGATTRVCKKSSVTGILFNCLSFFALKPMAVKSPPIPAKSSAICPRVEDCMTSYKAPANLDGTSLTGFSLPPASLYMSSSAFFHNCVSDSRAIFKRSSISVLRIFPTTARFSEPFAPSLAAFSAAFVCAISNPFWNSFAMAFLRIIAAAANSVGSPEDSSLRAASPYALMVSSPISFVSPENLALKRAMVLCNFVMKGEAEA